MQQGWIKLHRKTLHSPIFQNEKLFKIFMYCLMKASHKEHKQLVGMQFVELKSGQFIFGRAKASQELNMNGSTLWKYMKLLESDGVIEINSNNKFSIINVVKWGCYQHEEGEKEQQNNNKGTTEGQQNNTNKNVKNEKNVKEHIPYEEIVSYLNQKAGKRFSHKTNKTRDCIRARWNEGHRTEEFKQVIDVCVSRWSGQVFSNGKRGDDYLQPSTLFNGKFDERLNWSIEVEQGQEQTFRPDSVDLGGVFN